MNTASRRLARAEPGAPIGMRTPTPPPVVGAPTHASPASPGAVAPGWPCSRSVRPAFGTSHHKDRGPQGAHTPQTGVTRLRRAVVELHSGPLRRRLPPDRFPHRPPLPLSRPQFFPLGLVRGHVRSDVGEVMASAAALLTGRLGRASGRRRRRPWARAAPTQMVVRTSMPGSFAGLDEGEAAPCTVTAAQLIPQPAGCCGQDTSRRQGAWACRRAGRWWRAGSSPPIRAGSAMARLHDPVRRAEDDREWRHLNGQQGSAGRTKHETSPLEGGPRAGRWRWSMLGLPP